MNQLKRKTIVKEDGTIVLPSGETLLEWANREHSKSLDEMAGEDSAVKMEEEDTESYYENLRDNSL